MWKGNFAASFISYKERFAVVSFSVSVQTEVALLGQELMLCRAADQDLLREVESWMMDDGWSPFPHGQPSLQGRASVHQQLHFLQQLLTLLPGSQRSSGARTDTEMLLHELCTSEHVSQLLTPVLEPWPSHTRCVQSVCDHVALT